MRRGERELAFERILFGEKQLPFVVAGEVKHGRLVEDEGISSREEHVVEAVRDHLGGHQEAGREVIGLLLDRTSDLPLYPLDRRVAVHMHALVPNPMRELVRRCKSRSLWPPTRCDNDLLLLAHQHAGSLVVVNSRGEVDARLVLEIEAEHACRDVRVAGFERVHRLRVAIGPEQMLLRPDVRQQATR